MVFEFAERAGCRSQDALSKFTILGQVANDAPDVSLSRTTTRRVLPFVKTSKVQDHMLPIQFYMFYMYMIYN